MTNDQPNLFDFVEPVARTTDPQTSHQAAKSVKKVTRQALYDQILFWLAVGPLTDDELADRIHNEGLKFSPSGLRTRRAELVDGGLVMDSGQRKTLSSGRKAIVWSLTK